MGDEDKVFHLERREKPVRPVYTCICICVRMCTHSEHLPVLVCVCVRKRRDERALMLVYMRL